MPNYWQESRMNAKLHQAFRSDHWIRPIGATDIIKDGTQMWTSAWDASAIWKTGQSALFPFNLLFFADKTKADRLSSDALCGNIDVAAEVSIRNVDRMGYGNEFSDTWQAGGLLCKFRKDGWGGTDNLIIFKMRWDGHLQVMDIRNGIWTSEYDEMWGVDYATRFNTFRFQVDGRQIGCIFNGQHVFTYVTNITYDPVYFGLEASYCNCYFGPFYVYQHAFDWMYNIRFWLTDYTPGLQELKINQIGIPGGNADHLQFGGKKNRTLNFQCRATTEEMRPISTEGEQCVTVGAHNSIDYFLREMSNGQHLFLRTPYITTSGYIQSYTPPKPILASGGKVWDFNFNFIEKARYEGANVPQM